MQIFRFVWERKTTFNLLEIYLSFTYFIRCCCSDKPLHLNSYIITLPSQSPHLGAQLLRVRPCGKKAPGSLALAFKCLSQNYLTCQILARISHMMPFHHKEIRKYNLSLCWKYLMNYIKHNHAYNWLHIYINYLELGLQLLILVMEVSMNSKITCNSCNVSCPISFLLIYLSTGISLGQTY